MSVVTGQFWWSAVSCWWNIEDTSNSTRAAALDSHTIFTFINWRLLQINDNQQPLGQIPIQSDSISQCKSQDRNTARCWCTHSRLRKRVIITRLTGKRSSIPVFASCETAAPSTACDLIHYIPITAWNGNSIVKQVRMYTVDLFSFSARYQEILKTVTSTVFRI